MFLLLLFRLILFAAPPFLSRTSALLVFRSLFQGTGFKLNSSPAGFGQGIRTLVSRVAQVYGEEKSAARAPTSAALAKYSAVGSRKVFYGRNSRSLMLAVHSRIAQKQHKNTQERKRPARLWVGVPAETPPEKEKGKEKKKRNAAEIRWLCSRSWGEVQVSPEEDLATLFHQHRNSDPGFQPGL
jgi:hypothetical protein